MQSVRETIVKMKGYFVVYENEDEQFDIKCDLRPDIDDEVPEAQSILYSEVENTCNVLKALDKTSDDIKRKYFKKLLNLTQVGLVPENGAQPKMAMVALEKLKAEMLHIEGKRIKNQYMKRLGITAIILSAIVGGTMCILFHLLKNNVFSMMGYTWFGAMTGAWISYGARKFQLEFEDMSLIEKDMVEPTIRLIYIGVCSLIFELFLSCGVATITVGNITTDGIKNYEEIQILIGVLCGLVESKMGIDIYKKANSVVDIGEEKE